MVAIVSATNPSTTFADLINDVIANLQGYVKDQEQSTTLSAAIDAADLVLTYPASRKASAGIIEVDYELMWVTEVDQQSGTLTVPPWGRGYLGTTAASHATNARIVFNPRFPKLTVAKAINDTVEACGREVPAISSTTLTATAPKVSYELPADVDEVLAVSWEVPGATDGWEPIRRFDLDNAANSTAFATGRSLSIFDPVVPGRTIQVVYGADPVTLVNDDDTFSDTGYGSSMYDVILYGAAARLVSFADAGRIDFKSVSADHLDDPNPIGSAQQLSRQLYQMYRLRLSEEALTFRNRYQTRLRWTR